MSRTACIINGFGPRQSLDCTDSFDLTLLFEQSILSVGPSALLLLLFPIRALQLHRSRPRMRPGCLARTKLAVIAIFACLQLTLLVLNALPTTPHTSASATAAALGLIDCFALAYLSYVEHIRSFRPSTLLNSYLLFSGLFDGVQVRTLWLLPGPHRLAAVFTTALALKVILLLLEATEKRSLLRPVYQSVAIESTSGIINRSLFCKQGSSAQTPLIRLQHASFGVKADTTPILRNVSLNIARSSITMIVGPIGSGKSTLLKGLLGEVPCTDGAVHFEQTATAYCDQAIWLLNTSVRENITGHTALDSNAFDNVWYRTVIRACAMEEDLRHLPNHDASIVGSGGVNLSGGQKQRLALARALYAKCPLIILDDIFSGLDRTTDNIIFDRLFSASGLFRQLGITVVLATHAVHHLHASDNVIVLNGKGGVAEQGPFEMLRQSAPYKSIQQASTLVDKITNEESPADNSQMPELKSTINKDDLKRQAGDLSLYTYYFKSIGWIRTMLVLTSATILIFLGKFPQVWLEMWVGVGASGSSGKFVGIYVALAAACAISAFLCIGYFFVIVIPKSAEYLHWKLTKSVMRAPFWFLCATDTGVLLNRFSQDMSLVDKTLPLAAFMTILNGLTLSTIRALGWQSAFKDENIVRLDASQRPYYLLFCIQRWLNLILDLFVAGIAIILVSMAVKLGKTTTSGSVGLALVNVVNFSQSLSQLIGSWTTLETSLGAISRLKSFVKDTPSEDAALQTRTTPADWPSAGRVQIEIDSASYGPGTHPVLRNVHFDVAKGERVAICGRTGSGKSSLLLAILRLLDITSGGIKVDGIDITTVTSDLVRSSIATIPQELIKLLGTVKYNLDPASSSSDESLITGLKKVGLWDTIDNSGGLDAEIDVVALSQGQHQLFALVRAMLRHTAPIIVMDELTSSVDHETDIKVVRRLLREKFAGRTVIAVTHRLEGIEEEWDKVAVMDNGNLVEYGSPAELLAKNSAVRRLCGKSTNAME